MKYRLHTSQDYRAIAELRWLLKGADTDLDKGCGQEEFVERYIEHLGACDKAGATHHWLAEAENVVIGVMTVRRVLKEPSSQREAACWGYLTNCIIDQAHRNRGVGTELLSKIKEWAVAKDFELLIVWPSERSYPFYRRFGFVGRNDPIVLPIHPDGIVEDQK